MKAAFCGLVFAACMVAQAPVNCVGPISLDDVTGMLKNDVPPGRVRLYVTTCGVAFEFRPEAEKAIRAAGGTDAVVAAVREKAPKPPATLPAVPKPSGGKPGATRQNDIDGQTYVWIPPGKFVMGCSGDDECRLGRETSSRS